MMQIWPAQIALWLKTNVRMIAYTRMLTFSRPVARSIRAAMGRKLQQRAKQVNMFTFTENPRYYCISVAMHCVQCTEKVLHNFFSSVAAALSDGNHRLCISVYRMLLDCWSNKVLAVVLVLEVFERNLKHMV